MSVFDESFDVLGLPRPQIKGKSQEDVEQKLSEWKRTTLRARYRHLSKQHHPDLNPHADGIEFQKVQESYNTLLELKVRFNPPKKGVNRCPDGHQRIPKHANYCHECGYAYIEADGEGLISRLREAGVKEKAIEAAKEDLSTWIRLKSLDPKSSQFKDIVDVMMKKQELLWPSVNRRGWE